MRAACAEEFGEIGRWLIVRRFGAWVLMPPDSDDHVGPVTRFPTFEDARLAFIAQSALAVNGGTL